MRRIGTVEVREDTYEWLARRAIDERRSPRDQAAIELERLFPPRDRRSDQHRQPAEAAS